MTSGTEVQRRSSTVEWYEALGSKEKRTFWACFGGWVLDAMDVQVFSFAITAIMASFHISNADAGLIGTVTLLTSALGGWVAGVLADQCRPHFANHDGGRVCVTRGYGRHD